MQLVKNLKKKNQQQNHKYLPNLGDWMLERSRQTLIHGLTLFCSDPLQPYKPIFAVKFCGEFMTLSELQAIVWEQLL